MAVRRLRIPSFFFSIDSSFHHASFSFDYMYLITLIIYCKDSVNNKYQIIRKHYSPSLIISVFSFTITMMKEGVRMDKPQTNSNVESLKTRLHQFLETLESIEPETADLQDIDQLISMLDELEEQMDKVKTDN